MRLLSTVPGPGGATLFDSTALHPTGPPGPGQTPPQALHSTKEMSNPAHSTCSSSLLLRGEISFVARAGVAIFAILMTNLVFGGTSATLIRVLGIPNSRQDFPADQVHRKGLCACVFPLRFLR